MSKMTDVQFLAHVAFFSLTKELKVFCVLGFFLHELRLL